MNDFLMNRPVVVGVDGTEFSLKALDWAADHAVEQNCPLRIVHVQTGREPSAATVRAQVDNRLSFRNGPQPVTIWLVRFGSRSDILSDEARGARLLVLGHREPQPLLGSTLRGVLINGTSSVLVVPPGWSDDATTTGRIVVGVKNAASGRVLEVAFAIAARQGRSLQVITSLDLPTVHQGRTLLEETRRQEAKALADLETLLARLRRKYRDVVVEPSVRQGDPASVLTDAARNADLLVIGGRPRRGLPTLIGSTTESIMKRADRPVVVVRPTAARVRRNPDAA